MSILADWKDMVDDLLKTNRFAVEFPQKWKMYKNHYMLVSEVKGLQMSSFGGFGFMSHEPIELKILMGSKRPSIFSALSKVIKKYNEPDHSCLVSDECHCPSNNFKLGEDYLFVHQLDNEGSSVYKFKVKIDGITLKFPNLSVQYKEKDIIKYATLLIHYNDDIEIIDVD